MGRGVDWRVAMRPGLRRQLEAGGEAALREKEKASVRAKAEHPFFHMKRVFGYGKGALSGASQERAADRAAAGLRQPADRRAEAGRLSVAPARPEGGENAGNGVETTESRHIRGGSAPKALSNLPSPTASRRSAHCSDLP